MDIILQYFNTFTCIHIIDPAIISDIESEPVSLEINAFKLGLANNLVGTDEHKTNPNLLQNKRHSRDIMDKLHYLFPI